MSKFLTPLILVFVAAAAAATFGVSTAQASACSNALIHDWYVDGRIDKTYPVHCYREALKDIPEDQIVYGTLRDDLNRALALVVRNHHGDVGPMTPAPERPLRLAPVPSEGRTTLVLPNYPSEERHGEHEAAD